MRRALSVALALGAACRPDPSPTRIVNFDPASGLEELRAGWSGFEQTPEGDTFVWSVAPEARLRVIERAASDLLVRFRCWPFWYEGAPVQTIGLAVNGVTVEAVRMRPDRHVYTIYVPRELWRAGENELALAFGYTARPSDHGQGLDGRTLAVAFDWLEIVRPR